MERKSWCKRSDCTIIILWNWHPLAPTLSDWGLLDQVLKYYITLCWWSWVFEVWSKADFHVYKPDPGTLKLTSSNYNWLHLFHVCVCIVVLVLLKSERQKKSCKVQLSPVFLNLVPDPLSDRPILKLKVKEVEEAHTLTNLETATVYELTDWVKGKTDKKMKKGTN